MASHAPALPVWKVRFCEWTIVYGRMWTSSFYHRFAFVHHFSYPFLRSHFPPISELATRIRDMSAELSSSGGIDATVLATTFPFVSSAEMSYRLRTLVPHWTCIDLITRLGKIKWQRRTGPVHSLRVHFLDVILDSPFDHTVTIYP